MLFEASELISGFFGQGSKKSVAGEAQKSPCSQIKGAWTTDAWEWYLLGLLSDGSEVMKTEICQILA